MLPYSGRIEKAEKEEGKGKRTEVGGEREREERRREKGEKREERRERREEKKVGVTTRESGSAIDVQEAGGVCTLPAEEPAQLSAWRSSTGTAPTAARHEVKEWALREEVQNPGLGCGRDCSGGLDRQSRVESRWLRQECGRQEQSRQGVGQERREEGKGKAGEEVVRQDTGYT